MIGPEPIIAIAGSQRAWAAELLRFLSDFGGARLKGTVLTAREALEPGYEVLLIDDITSYLSPRLVERVRDGGQKVVGIYDPESGDRGRERLRALGVDAVVPARRRSGGDPRNRLIDRSWTSTPRSGEGRRVYGTGLGGPNHDGGRRGPGG